MNITGFTVVPENEIEKIVIKSLKKARKNVEFILAGGDPPFCLNYKLITLLHETKSVMVHVFLISKL